MWNLSLQIRFFRNAILRIALTNTLVVINRSYFCNSINVLFRNTVIILFYSFSQGKSTCYSMTKINDWFNSLYTSKIKHAGKRFWVVLLTWDWLCFISVRRLRLSCSSDCMEIKIGRNWCTLLSFIFIDLSIKVTQKMQMETSCMNKERSQAQRHTNRFEDWHRYAFNLLWPCA